MNRQLLSVLAGIGLMLGGCSLAPEYIQPQAQIPDKWPQGDAYQPRSTASDLPVFSELSLQEFLSDEHLLKIIDIALNNNTDLRLAALNMERVRALYGIQRAELFPSINVVGAGGKQQRSADLISPGDSRTREQYGIDLRISSWEIDFFGHLRGLKDQALEAYLATDEARRSVQIALIAETANAYLSLAADHEHLKLTQSTLSTQQDAYRLIQKSYDVGIVTELDLKRAEIPVAAARGDVAHFIQLVARDRNALNLLAGSQVPEALLPADLLNITPPLDISAGLSSEVLLRRPDIAAAEHQLKGIYALIGAARSAFFPRISLTTSFGTASDELSGLFGSGSGTWNFTPQVVMPIFDARTWAAYRVSKADRKIALTRYEKTIQRAFREVADALAVQGTIDQQIGAQQALVNAVTEAHRLSEERYKQGIDSYLGVLDAQRSQFAAQQGLVSLRLAKFVNRVRLFSVLGGGQGTDDGSWKGNGWKKWRIINQ